MSIGSGRRCWKEIGSDVDWKGWIRTSLLEGLDPSSIGRVGRDVNWKGVGRVGSEGCCWKGRRLDPVVVDGRIGRDVVDGRDVGSGCCCWKRIGRDVDWKGWKGRQLEGMLLFLLIVPIDVVVDCSDRCYCC